MNHAREIVCGKNAVREVLRAGRRRCYEVFLARGREEKVASEIKALAESKGITCHLVEREKLAAMARVEKHQGVAAAVEPFCYETLEELVAREDGKNGFILILDGIIDPQNLGSLIRTAHQLGVGGVVLGRDNCAAIGPAATRAAAGATEYSPIVQVVNISSALKLLKKKNYWVYGADGGAGKSIYTFDFKSENIALVLGGEGKGMRRLVREHCDHLVSIPMAGQLDSLNISVAGSILMSEIVRQRLGPKTK